ncbi:hypothetical protein V8E55_005511 [Tylopilus felleus]
MRIHDSPHGTSPPLSWFRQQLIDAHVDIVQYYDRDLPTYGTIRGHDQGQVTSPVLDAIDLVMHRVKKAGVDLGAIAAISGSAQQHGSVYWSGHAETAQETVDRHAFAAPLWQYSSTTTTLNGGPQRLADLTGSRAYERFTGP